jgi:putative toxin-antitoxin system antitoxin component (TIGR02293 family)
MLKCSYTKYHMSTLETMIALMGGQKLLRKHVRQDTDLEQAVATGLPAEVVRHLADSTGATLRQLQEITLIDRSTFSRRIKQRARLKVDESDRVARLARVAALAMDALGRDEGLRWLREPNVALGDRIPLGMLGTDAGARQVEQIIGRIEHGVFS